MGADIYSLVQQRILTPRFPDRRMREGERLFNNDGDIEAWEGLHTITWVEVKLLDLNEMAPFDPTTPWEDNFINHSPDITPWHEHRNYGLFGIIGGVRSRGGDPYVEGHYRGHPEGSEDVGDHSQTWYLCQELVEIDIAARMPDSYGVTTDVENFINMNKDLVNKYGARNVRILLGFDS